MRGETITGIHKGEPTGLPDAMGEPIVSEDVSYTIKHCLLAPSGSSESQEPFGAVVVSQVQVIVLNSIPDVRPTDILTFWGQKWQAEGLVGPWVKGRLMGSVFMVKRAT